VSLKPGWAEAAGKAAGERDRAERGARAVRLLTERQKLQAARDDYAEDMGLKAENNGRQRPPVVTADQWLRDARKQASAAGDAFAGLFDKGEN
jgi:hypothetical protein